MKTPRIDPLLAAILEDTDPERARRRVETSLAVLTSAGRHRRRIRTVQNTTAVIGFCVVLLAALWFQRPPGNGASPVASKPYALVRTGPPDPSMYVSTRPDTLQIQHTQKEDLENVSTANMRNPVELAPDDDTFLAVLPPGAGFIGNELEGRYLWLGPPGRLASHP